MPNRNKSNIKDHKGKLTYVSSNYQRIWNIKDDKLEVQSNVSVVEGESVTVPTEIPMDPDDIKISKKKTKKSKKNKIPANQEEGIGDRIIVSTDESVTDNYD